MELAQCKTEQPLVGIEKQEKREEKGKKDIGKLLRS